MSDFIAGVNRLLRINQIITGDDDNITTFSDTQHAADISLAQIAIQDELTEIVSDRLISYEKTTTTITLLTSTRTYALASDFIRFYGTHPSFYDSTDNVRLYEWKGGEDTLRDVDYQYKTTESGPHWWYWHDTTTKQVAFYYVPNSTFNNRSLSYDYEKSVMVTNSTDTLPFITAEEYQAFISCASRRFFFYKSLQPEGLLTSDASYNNAKSRLYSLLNPKNPAKYYGHSYN